MLEGAYPYTRRHAPSSTLHSSAAELGRWITAHLADGEGVLSPAMHAQMWTPETEAGGIWQAQIALGWFQGTAAGVRIINHSGDDPGFQTNLAIAPEQGIGVAVLANTNLVPFEIAEAALAVLQGEDPGPPPLPPVAVPVAHELEHAGQDAAAARFRQLAAEQPPRFDLDAPGFDDATWGALEMHRPEAVHELIGLWQRIEPDSDAAAEAVATLRALAREP